MVKFQKTWKMNKIYNIKMKRKITKTNIKRKFTQKIKTIIIIIIIINIIIIIINPTEDVED